MRQADGSELLGASDPRAGEIGVIYVAPHDDRKDVLTAILTQEKLGRRQIAVVLPEQNRAFQRPVDFDGLKMRRSARAQIVFVAPPGSDPADYARQRRFPVYSSLDNYIRSLHDTLSQEGGRRLQRGRLPDMRRLLHRGGRGGGEPGHPAAAPGAAVGDLQRQEPALQASPAMGTPAAMDLATPPGGAPPVEPPVTPYEEEPARPLSPGTAAAAGALAGAATGLGWAAMQHEREETHAESESGLAAADLAEDEDEGDLPPASTPLPSSGAGPSEEVIQESMHTTAGPPRPTASDAGPGIIQFPQRRVTAKLPAATSAYAPEVAPPPRRGTTGKMTAVAAGAGAGAAGAVAGAGMVAGAGAAAPGSGRAAPVMPPPPMTPAGPGGRRRRGAGWPLWLALLVLLLLSLLVACSVVTYVNPSMLGPVGNLVPFGTPMATVTITPISADLKNQYLITGVTGTPDPAQREVQARLLNATPQSQTKTAQATGHGQTAGVQARGTITFTHSVNSWQTVLKGTVFPVQGGLQVITDEAVSLPPTDAFHPVSRTGSAHVVQAGSVGNLPPRAVNQSCCSTDGSIFATSSAFTGGQDPQTFVFVQQSDIDGVANPLKASLAQQAQQQFHSQIRSGEQLISQPKCNASVKSDHQAGDHASSVTVTVTATCTGEAYDARGALQMGATLLSQEAAKSPGTGYALAGQIVTTISGAAVIDARSGRLSITVNAEGIWAYQFSAASKQSLARLIAGKSKSEALRLLQAQTGVKSADIQLMHSSGDLLPTDPGQITITVVSVPGLQPAPSPTSSAAPPGPTTTVPGATATVGKG